ncbi:MAG: peptide chain release factor 1 [Ruminococcaceae bacterium]|nr:peptide chain release factor 1 [Oscillospiraceae bacterium]
MLSKLKEAELRFEAIEAALSSPDVAADPEALRRHMQEYRRLSPIIEAYRRFLSAERRLSEAEALLRDEQDSELRLLAEEERKQGREEREALLRELTVLLLPRDENDDKNVIVEIRAGAGGEEAALFAGTLYRMYSMYAADHGLRIESISANPTELGGFREVSFLVEGEGAYSRLKFESGVHRVQRVPDTESQGRIHTSTVTVAVLPEVEAVAVEIRPEDLVIESMKSSGAGGQHVNKTESAIRMLHKPSGIVIECREERSQYKNRDKALKLLRARLYDMKQQEVEGKVAAERRSQVGSGDRSEKIRTYNYPQSRVTDHRIGFTTHNIESILNGNLTPLLDALASADTAEKLKRSQQT